MLKINNKNIIAPSSFQVDISDIDGESNRNAEGKMIRDRIAVKRKINAEWKMLDAGNMSSLLNAVANEFFTVTYPDPMTGGTATKTFYVGDRNAPMYNFKMGYWESLKMNFVEQ